MGAFGSTDKGKDRVNKGGKSFVYRKIGKEKLSEKNEAVMFIQTREKTVKQYRKLHTSALTRRKKTL